MSRTIGITTGPHQGYCVLGITGQPMEMDDWWHVKGSVSDMTDAERAAYKKAKAAGTPKEPMSLMRVRDRVADLIRRHAAHGSVRVAVRMSGDNRLLHPAQNDHKYAEARLSAWIEGVTLLTIYDLVPPPMVSLVTTQEMKRWMTPQRDAIKQLRDAGDADANAFRTKPGRWMESDPLPANLAQGRAAWVATHFFEAVTR